MERSHEHRAGTLVLRLPTPEDLIILKAVAHRPKDMLDIPATLQWLRQHGVHTAGEPCTGYLFCGESNPLELPLSAVKSETAVRRLTADGGLLILNPIPERERVQDSSILADAIKAGKQAEAEGRYYHPAANGEIDRRTGGYSSRIQLEGLQRNILLAQSITD